MKAEEARTIEAEQHDARRKATRRRTTPRLRSSKTIGQ